jgi:hypothetical protein
MPLTSISRIAENRGKIKIEPQNLISKGIKIKDAQVPHVRALSTISYM